MAWFSVGMPLLFQCVVPLGLLVWLMAGGHSSRAVFVAGLALASAWVVAIGVAGLWLVLPWYLPLVYAAVLVWAGLRSWPRVRPTAWRPATRAGSAVAMGTCALAVLLAGTAAVAVAGRRAPAEPVDLAFPLDGGTYLVANGGGSRLINAHLVTLEGERLRAYRGQSYGVDLVRIDRAGLRAHGLLPSDPADYVIFGDRVLAPCDGRVVNAVDVAPDLRPPNADREHMAGNHVTIACGPVWVLLGHLQRGSVEVRAGDVVEAGQPVGRVGNSGNTGEPHLHVHAQTPGTAEVPMGGEPVPIRLAGRYLVRNDRIRAGP